MIRLVSFGAVRERERERGTLYKKRVWLFPTV